MKIIHCADYNEASKKAYDLLLEEIKLNSSAVLGLPTGSTPLGIYGCMTAGVCRGDFSYADITTFNIDEYAGLSPDDSNSYYRFMRENLFDGIDAREENINIPSGLGNLEDNCLSYDKKIEDAGGIDIQVLGIGRNGHIGFNEPGTPFELTTHIAELTNHTREANSRFFKSFDDVPVRAVTMGIRSMMNARKIIFIAAGEEKSDAMFKTVCGPVSTDCPSSILQMHPDITIFLDTAAAGRL
jgi:glucosamine-6-phosphate deaminase